MFALAGPISGDVPRSVRSQPWDGVAAVWKFVRFVAGPGTVLAVTEAVFAADRIVTAPEPLMVQSRHRSHCWDAVTTPEPLLGHSHGTGATAGAPSRHRSHCWGTQS